MESVPAMIAKPDFGHLRNLLAVSKGRLILTINDAPAVRKLFVGDAFHAEPVSVTYRVCGAPTATRKLIITGANELD